jgi:predicted thioesterase
VGESIVASATVTEVNGKKIEFKVEAYCGDTLIGEGSHTRFIVDREKFLSRIL